MSNSQDSARRDGSASRSASRSVRESAYRILDDMHDYQERAGRGIIEMFEEELWRKEEVIRTKVQPQKHLLEHLRQEFATTTSALRNELDGKTGDLQKQQNRAADLLEAKERLETVSEDQSLKIGDLEAKVEDQRKRLADAKTVSKNHSATIARLESENDDKQDIIIDLEMVSKDRLSRISDLESKSTAQKEVIMDLEMINKAALKRYTKLEESQTETSKKADWQAGELKEMHEKLEGLMSLSRRTMAVPDVQQRIAGPELRQDGNAAIEPIIIDDEPDQISSEFHGPALPPAATPSLSPPPYSNFSPPSTRAGKLYSSLVEEKPTIDQVASQSSTLSEQSVTAPPPSSRKRKDNGKLAPPAKKSKRSSRKR
ncbi:hypothetical protein QFC21_001346 [Naganishia friedmannii]|uniref:Uncharacterized protein n=1 Tax=Naganishia friedmannii TaxID=89922 RepID=A0ACC2W6F1_9TREE|nr:hypothetical protein QFC21_001346 [Naganishia friedmannii]